jgi:glycosyltransferase involved in cell wall biosynthesis
MQAAYDISKELANRGHEVVVYTTDAKDLSRRVLAAHNEILDGIEVHRFRNVSMITVSKSKFFVAPSMIPEVKKRIQGFDLIHLHEYRAFQNIVLHGFARRYRKPVVVQAHGSIPRVGRNSRKMIFDILFGYTLLRDASKVIALSKMEAQQYRSMTVPDEKIEIIPNGIDLSKYTNLPTHTTFKKKYGIDEGTRIVLYLGRVHRSKSIGLLIQAYARLVKTTTVGNSILVIAGSDDGYLGEARDLVRDFNLDERVLFTGFVDFEDKLGALAAATVFVTPSFYGFPIAFLEACAAGVPIVTTTLGDYLDWINGNVGYVTKPNPQALAEAIVRILSNEGLRNDFSKRGIMLGKTQFSIKKTVDRLEQVYANIVGI